MGSGDGLSKHPYIRESRRIVALKTIVEQEVSAHFQPGPRAAHFADSVGVGWYPIDIHRAGAGGRRRQLPHAAVPDSARRVAAGAHDQPHRRVEEHRHDAHHERLLSAASGRMEHRRGSRRAGGVRARAALDARRRCAPSALGAFQRSLLADGVPLAWLIDVGVGHPSFAAVQSLFMAGRLDIGLRFEPDAPLSESDWRAWGGSGPPPPTVQTAPNS